MYISLFAIAVAIMVFGQQVLKSIRYKKFLKRYAAEHHVDILSTQRPLTSHLQAIVPIAFCLICAVYLVFNLNTTVNALSYLTIFIILGIVFSASIFTNEVNQCIFYTDDIFLLQNSEIKFRDIRELISSRFKACEVVLKKGGSIKVSKKQLNALKELCSSKKLRVKSS